MSEKMSEERSSSVSARQPKVEVFPQGAQDSESNPNPRSGFTAFSGPLPPPSLLSGYESSCPGAADRIIKMAEQEAEHRRVTETAIVKAGVAEGERASNDAKRGQIFALIIVMASISGCIFLSNFDSILWAKAAGAASRQG